MRADEPGTGEMARLVLRFDWSATPLGARECWLEPLRTAAGIVLESRHPMLLLWGERLTMLYNDAFVPLAGDRHPDALGGSGREVFAEVWPTIGPVVERVLETGEATWVDDQPLVLSRHGAAVETFWSYSHSPVRDGRGRVVGVFSTTNDTTSRVVAARRLAALRDLGGLPRSADNSVAAVCSAAARVLAEHHAEIPYALFHLVEPDGSLLVAAECGAVPPDPGRAGAVTAAWRSRESMPRGISELLVPLQPGSGSDSPGVLALGLSAHRVFDKDYQDFLVLVSGQVSAAVGDARAYQEQRRQIADLAELDRLKTEFFANISHEFRTPLTLITGETADAVADEVAPLAPAQRDRAEVVLRNAERLRRLVDDLLDLARLEAGALTADPTWTDLAALTEEVSTSFAPAVSKAGLAMVLRCSPLPRLVAVDRGMWEKVVLNLLSNAVKYTLTGHIDVELLDRGDSVELVVRDTGVGVREEELPQLFTRFHRAADGRGRSFEGAGIGLALVDELVRLHGGSTGVTSTVGLGSAFTVRIPYGEAAAEVGTTPPAGGTAHLTEALRWSDPANEPVSRAPKDAPTVLVVDDNPDLRRFVTALLSPTWKVVQAPDGVTALARVAEDAPDLVLTDVMMPGMSGFELLHTLRADPATAELPVVFLSARAGEDAAVEALDAGADDFLPKPFSPAELVARIRSNLELARLRTRAARFRKTLVEALQEGFFLADAAGTVIEANTAFGTITGYPASGVPFRWPYPWLSEGGDRHKQERVHEQFLRHGGGEFLYPIRHRDGHRVWVSSLVATLPDRTGAARMSVGTVRDVTARVTATNREATLARFTGALATAVDVDGVLGAGLPGVAEAFAAWSAAVVLWRSDTPDPRVVSYPVSVTWDSWSFELRRAMADAARRRAGAVAEVRDAAGPALVTALGAADAVLLVRPRSAPDPADRSLFALMSQHLALATARARSFDETRGVALTLQHALLGPSDLPPGFAVRYEPAVLPLEVGGDWYDVVRLPGGRIGIVVGDCVGNGLAAAAVMGQLRSACRALLRQSGSAADALRQLDGYAEDVPGASCTTVFCGIVDPVAGTVTYSRAGHPPPVLLAPDGSTRVLDEAGSLPLAVLPDADRVNAQTDLPPGSLVLLYTDGLVERRDEPWDVGLDRLRASLSTQSAPGTPLAAIIDRVFDDLRPASGYDDDVAVVAYRSPKDR
ncbi:SpoIIE family protein phosphatase [Actinokineospora terrae]|uniref:histidine kinase n=1 Tax=Actinokineospora terrae TaxID=155974 RepID=A0A1H9KDN4_9PSEU|nr:SpoIIE family protein phosphatase [Actinokineospora terrae]SEQ97158.1 PAS domain S-box-containing protein [Actinokineospora terrae]